MKNKSADMLSLLIAAPAVSGGVISNGLLGYLIGGIVALLIMGYLVYTLIRPDKF